LPNTVEQAIQTFLWKSENTVDKAQEGRADRVDNSTEFFAQLHYSNVTKPIYHHSKEMKLTTFSHINMLCTSYGMPTPTKTTKLV
jgi:hypothetical protein